MPITFTDDDFADAPAEKLTFTDADFSEKPTALPANFTPPFNAYVAEQMRAAESGQKPYNPMSGGYVPGISAPPQDTGLVEEIARKPWGLVTAPFEIGAGLIEEGVRKPIEWIHHNIPTVQVDKPDQQRDYVPPPDPNSPEDAQRAAIESINQMEERINKADAPRQYSTAESLGMGPDTPLVPMPRPDQHGVGRAFQRFISPMTSSVGVAQLPLFEFAPVRMAYAGSTFASVPESIKDFANAKTDAERREALADITIKTAMGTLMARSLKGGPHATEEGRIQESRIGEHPGDASQRTPTEAGDSGGTAPAAGLEEKAQVPLSAEEKAYLDAEREGMGVDVDYATPEPGEPFAGEIATINRKTGRVVINPAEFSSWLKTIPEASRKQAVQSLLSEEKIHLSVDDASADEYWKNLTAAEKAIVKRRYTGTWSGKQTSGGAPVSITDTGFGHEAVRFRMQQLARMTPREIAEAVGREKWTLQGITAVESAIRKARETIGTKASGTQKAILDRMQENLNAATAVVSGQNPSALRKESEPTADDIVRIPASDWPSAIKNSGFRDQTAWSYDFGSKIASEDIPQLEKLRKQATDEDLSALRSGKQSTMGMKGQFFGEAIKWRKALDTAKEIKNPTDEQLSFIERELGVGDNTGAELRKALETEPKDQAREVPETKVSDSDYQKWGIPAPESGKVRLYNGSFLSSGASGAWWTDNPYRAGSFGTNVKYIDVAPEVAARAKEAARQRGQGGSSHLITEDQILKSAKEVPNPPMQAAHDLDSPAAIRKGRGPEDHPELFLPKLTMGKGTLSQPEREPAEEALRKAEEARYQPVTPQAVKSDIQTHLTSSPRPNFEEFSGQMKSKYGNIQPEQLREAWRDNVWGHLMSASGAELGRLRRALGLGRELGSERAIADAANGPRGFQLEMQPEGGVAREIKLADKQAAERIRSEQNYRSTAIATIGRKLIQESETGRKAWNRKDVSPEEIGFWRRSVEPAWNTITGEDISNPEALGRILTADAREEATTRVVRAGGEEAPPVSIKRKAPPVSVTKRLTAMLNKRTGEVDLVDTYRDGRRGAVLYDPQAPGRTHSTLSSMLARYRPIHSILLDEPVQNFHKRFASVREFEEQFGSEARNRAAEHTANESALPPEAGVLTGAEEAPSALTPGQRLTDAEAGSLFDSVHDEVGTFEGPEDVGRLVEGLHDRMTAGKTDVGDWAAIAALEKIYNAVRRKWPQLTPEQSIDQTYDEIADLIKRNAEDRKGFQQEAVGRYSPEVSRPAGSAPPPPAKPVETGARELSTIRDVPPTVDPSVKPPAGPGPEPALPEPKPVEMLSPQDRAAVEAQAREHFPDLPRVEIQPMEEEGSTPSAINKAKAKAQDEFAGIRDTIRAWSARRRTNQDIVRWRDAADTTANNFARQAGNSVRVQSKSVDVRAAAKAVIAAAGDKLQLDKFLQQIEAGRVKAEAMIARRSITTAAIGRGWANAAEKLKSEVEYAKAHWNDAELQNTAKAMQRELKDEFDFETSNGVNLKNVENYVPGRYDAEFFNDNAVMFGDQRILGRNFRKPKAFPNYYAAIEQGPYIPKSYDGADLVEHRVRQGRKQVNKQLWLDSLRNVNDPDSGKPVVEKPKIRDGRAVPSSPEHELFSLGAGQDPVSVRTGYKDLLEAMTMQGSLSKSPAGKLALAANGLLKHGVILILDTFHPARLGQYAASLLGREAGFRGGWSALDYREADLPEAIKKGYVSKAAADWANKTVDINLPNGRKAQFTRRQVLEEMQRQGLNVGKIQDAIYKDLVRNWPVIGTLNRWTFDVMTRGLMAESAVRSFEKLNEKYPHMDPRQLMRDVIRDTNLYYGSIGRQGWIRNPTIREISQLLFLAPQWVEGLVQKEARLYGRIAAAPVSVARGTPILGALGSGMAKGLMSYFLLTQVMNLITRRQTTFQNKEEGHKLDAWIPTGEDSGFWLSPMSVFAEITHDVLRLGESKPNIYEAIRQIGANKLSPLGRLAWVFASRQNSQGQRITTTPGMIGEMAKQLMPAPISLGTPARAIGHAIAPKLVSPPPPGALQQRLLGAAGIKVQPGDSALTQAQRTANEFMQQNGLKPETGFVIEPTDEPSYSKLRAAIRNDDPKSANRMMEELRKTHTDEQILKAMQIWSKRPLTGSNKGEMLLLNEMTDEQFDVYAKALEQRQKLWNDFVDFYLKN